MLLPRRPGSEKQLPKDYPKSTDDFRISSELLTKLLPKMIYEISMQCQEFSAGFSRYDGSSCIYQWNIPQNTLAYSQIFLHNPIILGNFWSFGSDFGKSSF